MLENILNLKGVTILSKSQQQKVSAGCSVNVGGAVFHGLTYERASSIGAGDGNNWCCASCSGASWINQ